MVFFTRQLQTRQKTWLQFQIFIVNTTSLGVLRALRSRPRGKTKGLIAVTYNSLNFLQVHSSPFVL